MRKPARTSDVTITVNGGFFALCSNCAELEAEIEQCLTDVCDMCERPDRYPVQRRVDGVWFHGPALCAAYAIRERRYERLERAEASKGNGSLNQTDES